MGILTILLFIKGCNTEHKYNNEVQKVMEYRDTVKMYAAKDGTTVNYNNTLKTNIDVLIAAQDSMRNVLENLKIPEPDIITIIKERFYIDSIPSIGLNTTDCKFDTTFAIVRPYYEVKGRVTNKELSLKSIMIPNKMTLVIGDRKEKWWKRKEHIATVTNSNPHISNEGIQSFVLNNERSWSIRPSVGYGFYYDPWKGSAGHGINAGISINFKIRKP